MNGNDEELKRKFKGVRKERDRIGRETLRRRGRIEETKRKAKKEYRQEEPNKTGTDKRKNGKKV